MTWSSPQKGFSMKASTTIGSLAAKTAAGIKDPLAPSNTEHIFLWTELAFRGMISGLGTSNAHLLYFFIYRSAESAEAESRIEESDLTQWDINREPADSVLWKWGKVIYNASTEDAARIDWKVKLPKNGLPHVEDKGWAYGVYNLGNDALPAGARSDIIEEYMGVWAS